MLRSIISRLGTATAPAREAVGRIASGVGNRVSNAWRRARTAIGGGAIGAGVGSRIGGGSSGSTNELDDEFNDYSENASRANQLVALNNPIESSGGFSEGPNAKGTFDPAVLQILKSIDSNIRAMRDSINNISASQNSSRNYIPRASSMSRGNFSGDYALTGLGLLGVAAGQVNAAGQPRTWEQNNQNPNGSHPVPPQSATQPAPPAPQIASVVTQPDAALQQSIGLQQAPNNDVLSQPPTAQNRTAHTVDISQLRSAVASTRSSLQENNRNPRQNGVILRIINDADNNITELERLYNTQNPDMDAITDLRRQILERIQSARNYITPIVTPQENNRSVPDQTPDVSPSTAPTPPQETPNITPSSNTTPGPQSNFDNNNMETVVNNRMEDYFQSYNSTTENTRNNYLNYLVSSMANNNSISVQGKDLTSLDIISGNEDNVSRRLEAIQVKNDASPVYINAGGGQQQAPQIIQQQAPQQNTPAPQPGTGDIIIGYRSHPMLVNEPRSPALISHP